MVFDSFKIIRIKGTPERLFSILKDVERWPVWDVDLKSVRLNGDKNPPSLEGATGNLTMNNGRSFDFTIHNVKENAYVSYLTKLPGADADWYWDFKKSEDNAAETELKMGVTFTGGATFLYKFLLGRFLGPAFEVCTNNLKTLVEEGKVNGQPHDIGK
ncbi:hypothetical protein HDU97_001108 [Phlyctochytrium planicorne]|nr:hypothetical protein HDU97_001108 [Phlyctochytrium planicorne]